MSLAFDTLSYTKGAEAVGIKREHAEYQAEQFNKLIDNTLATKIDLKTLEYRLTLKLGSMLAFYSGIMIMVLGYIIKH